MARREIVIHVVTGEAELSGWCARHEWPCYELPMYGLTAKGVGNCGSVSVCVHCEDDHA